jgi:hypothetical protein
MIFLSIAVTTLQLILRVCRQSCWRSRQKSRQDSEEELLDEEQGGPSKPPKSVDKSEALFTMYLDRSDEDDSKTTEKWKGECDAILVFVSDSYKPYLRVPFPY